MACIVSLNRLYRPQATGYRTQDTGHRPQATGYNSATTAAAAQQQQQQQQQQLCKRTTATATAIHHSYTATAIRPMQKAKKMGMRIWIWHPPLSLSIGFLIGGHCPCHHTTQTLWVSNIFYYLCIKANNYEKDI